MRILLVSSRAPVPPYSGDRLRALLWIEALREHDVTLVAPRGGESGARQIEVHPSAAARASAAIKALADGLPRHTILAAHDWRAAFDGTGPFDTAIVLLTRTDPWVFDLLPAKRKILDAIDSATAGMLQRATASSGLARRFWLAEATRCQRLETDAGKRYDRVLTVTTEELSYFGGGEVLPVGIAIGEKPDGDRSIDFGFWGRLSYFANREAVRVLTRVLWPRIRAHRPAATLMIGGADAPFWIRRLDGRNGIQVISPMNDRASLLRRIRVALLPITAGSGQSIKTLEAAEAGCAIAGTTAAFRGCGDLMGLGVVEDDPHRLADLASGLLADPDACTTIGLALRDSVVASFARDAMLERMRAVV